MKSYRYSSLIIAIVIFMLWLSSLFMLFSLDLAIAFWRIVGGMMAQTFLYTGLFITAHDAIHGTILPGKHRINGAIGSFLLFVYALFPFVQVRKKHFQHHRFPGSHKDPDYHDGKHPDFGHWYFHFLINYISLKQVIGMALIFNLLHHLLQVPVAHLLLFWVVPALFSTLQLFYFGTYLPHREPSAGYDNPHHAKSNDFHPIVSFLTCYHFGYHWEHHEYPGIPWWRLPAVRLGKCSVRSYEKL